MTFIRCRINVDRRHNRFYNVASISMQRHEVSYTPDKEIFYLTLG